MPMQADFLELTPSQTLSAGFPDAMVLLDCETTGGRAAYHRIIEIGLIIIEQGNVTETWQTFIDPERELPTFIQNLTGIRPSMLNGAPLFADIAETLLEKLQGRVLVAHNARFDYGFIKNEFTRVGIDYSTKPLCSVKFSRTMFPQCRRHGLDQIIQRFKFSIDQRHRALDDALMIHKFFLAATSLFSESEIAATCDHLIKTTTLPALLDPNEIKRLPNAPGVYYFYDGKGALLYVGKSVNIRNRVLSHFSQDHKHHKALKMSGRITHIDFTLAPTDFGAQLLESREIKTKQPVFNSRLRKVKKLWQIALKENRDGYLMPNLESVQIEDSLFAQAEKIGLFRSRRQATAQLEKLANQFFLCHQLLGLESANGPNRGDKPCFRFQLKRCFGACCQQEAAKQYNERLLIALKGYQKQAWPYNGPVLITESGKYDKKSEQADVAFHLVDQWVYLAKLNAPEDINDYALNSPHNNIAHPTQLTQQDDWQSGWQDNTQDALEFDLDTYFILIRFLLNPHKHELHGLTVVPLARSDGNFDPFALS